MDLFLLILVIILLMIAFTFILSPFAGSPPIPATPTATKTIIKAILKHNPNGKTILEIGCAWGGQVLKIAKAFPNRKIIAYEISPIPFLIASIRKTILRRTNLTIHYSDAFKAIEQKKDKYDCIVFYLNNEFFFGENLLNKSRTLLNQAQIIIANTYPLPNEKPIAIEKAQDIIKSKIYVYKGNTKEIPSPSGRGLG